jgi:hypothetical protein
MTTTTTNNIDIRKLSRFQRLVGKLPSYTIIWLSIYPADENYLNTVEKLRNEFSNLKTFEDFYLCEEYIENSSINEQIIVIVTNCQSIKNLYDNSKIIAIYVYYDVKIEQQSIAEYAQRYPKVCISIYCELRMILLSVGNT